MRKLSLLTVAILCLALAAPALAGDGRQQEQAPWAGVIEWVKDLVEGVLGDQPNGNRVPSYHGEIGGAPDPNGAPSSQGEVGGHIEPNG